MGNMSGKLTEEEQKAIEKLSAAVAKELAEGKKKEEVTKKLLKQGWPKESANNFVENINQALERYKNSPEGQRILASKYKRHMIYGVLWAVGGTAVTAATYSAASSGGVYFVAWGAILFGIIDFFRGLFGWLKYRS